jgi:hypothetical protein
VVLLSNPDNCDFEVAGQSLQQPPRA